MVVDSLSKLVGRAKRFNLINCQSIRKDNIEVSYLQFADDTIILSLGNEDKFLNLVTMVELFCHVSGLKINLSMSCILSINCAKSKVIALANYLGSEVGTWLLKYLSLPLEVNPRIVEF